MNNVTPAEDEQTDRDTHKIKIDVRDEIRFIQSQSVAASILKPIRRSGKMMEIENPIDSGTSYFVSCGNEEITLTREASKVIRNPKRNVDYDFVLKNILTDERYGPNTVWHDIKTLAPGSSIIVSTEGSSKALGYLIVDKFEKSLQPNFADQMDLLQDEIGRHVEMRSAKNVIVLFSGGRDSAGLLAAATKSHRDKLSAVTWTYSRGNAHEDLHASRNLSKNFGIPHCIIDIEPRLLLSPLKKDDLLPTVSISAAFVGFKNHLERHLLSVFGKNSLVLDGHGGDHIYLDPVPWEVIYDAAKFGIRSLHRTATALCFLHGASLSRLWLAARRAKSYRDIDALFSIEDAKRTHENKPTKRSAKLIHRELIKMAIHQNSVSNHHNDLHYLTPYTARRMIESVWDLPPLAFFDKSGTRIPFIQSFQKFNKHIELRSDKGHMTGAYQQAVKEKKKILSEMLGDGLLRREGLLNVDNAITALSRAAAGYGGIGEPLMKTLCFELMVSAR